MNALEANDFIDNVLKEMWPKWEPTDWQLKAWKIMLLRCDFEGSKRAIEYWYGDTDRPGREPILGTFKKIKVADINCAVEHRQPLLLFRIAPLDSKAAGQAFYSMEALAPYEIEDRAEKMRKKFDKMYKGDFVVIRSWEKQDARQDDGLRGQDAKDKVEADILAGPDCSEKRFLTGTLKRTGNLFEPTDDIPF